MRIAITGSKGQLGSALLNVFADEDFLEVDLPKHDITDLAKMCETVSAFSPDMVVHTAALTDVDGCERNPKLAYRVNVLGTRNVAVAAQQARARLVYISTDYVFDGQKADAYWEFDTPNPQSVYARTKWLGERMTTELSSRYYIVRTAWLYGRGPSNFVRTVLRLARERDWVQMVTDEIGSPTYALDVAHALWKLVQQPAYGIYHLTNSGTCSRYEWAQEILRLAGRELELRPLQNYRRAAQVPKRVALRNFCAAELGIVMRPWQEALQAYLVDQADD